MFKDKNKSNDKIDSYKINLKYILAFLNFQIVKY